MTDFLLRTGLSNLVIAAAIAALAWAVQRTGRHPRAAHLLWLFVLVKLVTPSFFTVPVISLPADDVAIASTTIGGAVLAGAIDGAPLGAGALGESASTPLPISSILGWAWLIGSALVLVWSLVRILRFHRVLGRASEPAPKALQHRATQIAGRLGLRRTPLIQRTRAHVSPMVWWVGGRVRVVIPADLTSDMDAENLGWVLAHELAHVKRGDHVVRWLEWLACVLCWWNPVAWWARKNLRTNEEVCCDALVLSSLSPNPRTYASSLLTVVEFLSAPALRPPAIASGMSSGGSLERRFQMIVQARPTQPTPRWLSALVLVLALAVLPLGIARAEDERDGERPTPEQIAEVEKKIEAAIAAGEITQEQGRKKLEAFIRHARNERVHDDERRKHLAEVEEKIRRLVEAGELTEKEGRAKLEAHIERVRSHGRKAHAERLGLDRHTLERIHEHLAQTGFTPEQIEHTHRALVHIVHHMLEQGERFELHPELRGHLAKKAGLGDAQIDTVVELAGRAAKSIRERRARDKQIRAEMAALKKSLTEAVAAGEITEEEAKAKWSAYVDFVSALHGRMPSENRHEQEIAEVRQRLERAVEAGEITEEEAERKLKAILVKADKARAHKLTDKKLAAVKKELEAAVEAGQITEEEAKKRLEDFLKKFRRK